MTLEENIKGASRVCKDPFSRAHHYETIYPFTTENISSYIDYFDLKGRSLLTVGSSGDQAINAALRGASDITLLDINPYTRYYFYLKIASIISLNKEEFHKYLGRWICFDKLFQKGLYKKVRKTLSELDLESYEFWEALYRKFKPREIRYGLFQSEEDVPSVIELENPYLNGESYKRVKEIASSINITFINQDLLYPELSREYDNIWLSNVYQHLKEEERRTMFINMLPYLEDNGSMLFAYIYGPGGTSIKDPESLLNTTTAQLRDYPFEVVRFEGLNSIIFESHDSDDAVMIYKKPSM